MICHLSSEVARYQMSKFRFDIIAVINDVIRSIMIFPLILLLLCLFRTSTIQVSAEPASTILRTCVPAFQSFELAVPQQIWATCPMEAKSYRPPEWAGRFYKNIVLSLKRIKVPIELHSITVGKKSVRFIMRQEE